MSDFVGILVTGGKAMHLVDWSRPAWFDPDRSDGLRVVPDLQHFVADALLVMYANGLTKCGQECAREPEGLNDLTDPQCNHVQAARQALYESFDQPMVFMHSDEQPDGLVLQDLGRFKRAPHACARIEQGLFDRNNW